MQSVKSLNLIKVPFLVALTSLWTACNLQRSVKNHSTVYSEITPVSPKEISDALMWIERNLAQPNANLSLASSSPTLGTEGSFIQVQHPNIDTGNSYYSYNDYLSQKQWKDVFLSLTLQMRKALALAARGSKNFNIKELSDVAMLLPPLANVDVYFSNEELSKALQAIPTKPTGVSYNAHKERFVYTNKELEWNILIIANRIGSNFYSFRQIFAQLPMHKQRVFTQNLQSSEPWTKTQPFDLIQGMMATLANREVNLASLFLEQGIHRTILTKQIQKGLYNLFGMNPTNDVRASAIPDIQTLQGSKPRQGEYLLVCNNDEVSLGFISDLKSLTLNIGLSGFTKFNSDKLVGRTEAKISCGFEDYSLYWSHQSKSKTLPMPSRLNLLEATKGRPIEALVTFALTDETDLKSIGKLKQFMKYRGYKLVQEQDNIATEDHFKSEFIENDIYIPVSHSMDVNNFDIGTSRSLKLVFEKKVDSKKVRLTALFPRKALEPKFVRLKVATLSELLKERRGIRPQSAFILNASCNADLTIYTWSRAFHGAIKGSDFTSVKDTPHVMASTNSFPTSSWVDLLSNFSYPLNAIDLLAEGKYPAQVYQMLESKPDNGIMFNLLAKVYGTVEGDVKAQPFKPVYNLMSPDSLKLPQVKFHLSPKFKKYDTKH